jgi:hypothetical protein
VSPSSLSSYDNGQPNPSFHLLRYNNGDTETDSRMNKILSKHFMDPEDVVVKKDEPEAL